MHNKLMTIFLKSYLIINKCALWLFEIGLKSAKKPLIGRDRNFNLLRNKQGKF